jgi:hypothetical protein
MRWITRSRVHVDRVACPWLIKRFIDAQAEFIFVTPNLVNEVAKSAEAIPFDVKGAELGHHSEHCSFISFLRKYNLTDPALVALGEVVNAADLGNLDTNPFARGLEAIAQGFSVLYPDDFENIEHQLPVYDALYNFFRLQPEKRD